MVVRKVLNSLLPEGGRYGGQEGFKLIVTRRLPLWWSGRFQTHCYQKVAITAGNNEFKTFLTTITATFW
jgi:hypothetical protein